MFDSTLPLSLELTHTGALCLFAEVQRSVRVYSQTGVLDENFPLYAVLGCRLGHCRGPSLRVGFYRLRAMALDSDIAIVIVKDVNNCLVGKTKLSPSIIAEPLLGADLVAGIG